MMTTPGIAVFNEAGSTGLAGLDLMAKRPRLIAFLFLSAWCGLVAGLLEVATIVLRKQAFDPNRLYWMSRHFVWLIPLTNLGIFLALGLVGCIVGVA